VECKTKSAGIITLLRAFLARQSACFLQKAAAWELLNRFSDLRLDEGPSSARASLFRVYNLDVPLSAAADFCLYGQTI